MKICRGCTAPVPVTGNAKLDREKMYCSKQCQKRHLMGKYRDKRKKFMNLAECQPHRCPGCGGKIVTHECMACQLRGVR